jgi:hypothetical protein
MSSSVRKCQHDARSAVDRGDPAGIDELAIGVDRKARHNCKKPRKTRTYRVLGPSLKPSRVTVGAHGASTVGPLLQLTRSIPIVFPIITDPVGAGYVESLARPGGNATGFMSREYSLSAKHLSGAAQRYCAGDHASGGPSGYQPRLHTWPVCSHTGHGAIATNAISMDTRRPGRTWAAR